MTPPRATYRLQFRSGVDFEKAASLSPYLARLGVSHLYASPLFQATPGSTHGYDVTDFGKLDESLGGDDGFSALSAALRKNGLGLVLDIVPNHMAASCHNPWWADVLRHGRASRYAGHFDIDWSQPKLLLPILGRPYGTALIAKNFSIGQNSEGLTWRVSGQVLPLDPRTWALVLEDFTGVGLPEPDAAAFRIWRRRVGRSRLASYLAELSRNRDRMHQIHEAQNWRLAYWRAARDMLGYRRFFEISDLVGVRVEDVRVFDDVHRLLFDLVDGGHVDGIRVDHVDGLADPKGYLERLAESLPRPVPIWVEKILEREERLPADWPVAGATGYESMAMTAAALTDGAAEPDLDRAYTAYSRTSARYPLMRDAAKREVLTRNLAAELETLVGLLQRVFATRLAERDEGPDTLRRAVIALLVAMPVYRTYFGSGQTPDNEAVLARPVDNARADPGLDDPDVIEAVAGCLTKPLNPAAHEFRTRFQQVSGALMAKAVEDTLFYRFNRLVSANEVGADPSRPAVDTSEFHAFAADRAHTHPLALNATATHDTKRGEDARMRIAAISEAPEQWSALVSRLDASLADAAALPEIDANMRWLFYQALLGSWQPGLSDDLPERIGAFLLKAAREAKVRTSWVRTRRGYERRLQKFVEGALSHAAFIDAFADGVGAFIDIGERKSLAQLALKLTLPGIPDIYQGTEAADLSLVDPDNRRPVDFDNLDRRLSKIEGKDASDDFNERKLALLSFGLKLRRNHGDVFAGAYRPLSVEGGLQGRVLAFARQGQATTLVVAAHLSGNRSASTRTVSLDLPEERTFGDLIAAFPSVEPAAPDGRLALDLQALGLSIRLFAG